MAQVNSTPGQNQTAANVTVAASETHVGAPAIVVAKATVVPYAQNEPGALKNPIRS